MLGSAHLPVPLPAGFADFVKSADCYGRLVVKGVPSCTWAWWLRVAMRDTMGDYRFRDARTAFIVAAVGLLASAGCCAWSIPSYRIGEATVTVHTHRCGVPQVAVVSTGSQRSAAR